MFSFSFVAFVSEMLEVKVKRAACAFSLNFCSDKKWAGVKNALELVRMCCS